MRITVFGAAGNVGSRVVTEALSRGHEVTAVVRNSARFKELPDGVRHRTGDANNVEDVVSLSNGQDAVISATRPAAGSESDLVRTTQSLLAGVRKAGARLLVVGGAGSLLVPGSDGTLIVDDSRYVSKAWRAIAQAACEQLEVCRKETAVDWAYLSPPAVMEPGERTGNYRLGADQLLVDSEGNSRISVEDLAVVLLDETERPSHHQARFTAAY